MLQRLGVHEWDIALIGDGSGTGWADPCGWGTILVERASLGRRLFYGGMNCGSINFVELFTYLHALIWYHATYGRARLKEVGTLRVHIISDSRTIVTQGVKVRDQHKLPKTQPAVWAAMQQLTREGYQFHYHWIPRETVALNWAADQVAGKARRAVKDVELVDDNGNPLTAYELNEDRPSG